jgi:hypothetical protein
MRSFGGIAATPFGYEQSARTIRGDGHYQAAAFGVSDKDVDESNAAQLWSTVYLAIQEPAKTEAKCKDCG